jgi:hypothetical protein
VVRIFEAAEIVLFAQSLDAFDEFLGLGSWQRQFYRVSKLINQGSPRHSSYRSRA